MPAPPRFVEEEVTEWARFTPCNGGGPRVNSAPVLRRFRLSVSGPSLTSPLPPFPQPPGDAPGVAAFGRFRLALLVVAVVVVAGLGVQTAVKAVQGREQAEADAVRQTQNLARTLEMQARGTFREVELAVATVAEALTPRPGAPAAGAEAVRAMIAARLSADGVLRNIVVADAHGDVRHDGIPGTAPVNIADREHFRIHRDRADAGTVISQPILGRTLRGWYVALSRRVNDSQGGFAGVVFAALDLSHLERTFAAVDLGPNGTVTLWNRDGVVLARHPREEAVAADPAHFAEQMRQRLAEGQREVTRHGPSPVTGAMRVATIRVVEGLPLAVSVRLAEAGYLAPWRDALRRDAVTLGVVVAVVAVLTALLLGYLRRLEGMARALQASERRARATFDSTYQYMGILAPDGTVLALNRAAQDFTGAEREGGVGRPAWERRTWAAVPESAERLRAAVREAAAGGSVRFEAQVQAVDGEPRTVDFCVKPVRDDQGRVVLLLSEAHDITERYRMETDLRRSEARLRSYLDAAMEGIFVADGAGCYVDVNPAACQMLGYTRDELLSLRISDLVPADHPLGGPSLAAFGALLQTGVFRGEVVMRRKDGAVLLSEINAVRLDGDRYLGVVRDVTERRHAEEALRSSRARLAALLQALPDLAFLLDGQGRYQEVLGMGTHDLLAAPLDSVVGRSVAEVLPKEAAGRVHDSIRRTIDTGAPQVIEYALTVPAGRRWFEGRTTLLPPDFGPEPMVLLLARDVTERVRAAERLAHAKEQAESANRTKGAFLATMSHELRTPLNAIIGFSEIMVHEVFGPLGSERYRTYAAHIQTSGTHLLELINDVLDMSKLEAGRYELDEHEVELAELLDSCMALTAVPAEQGGVRLVTDLPPDLPNLRADERAVWQIVLNLLSNAVKFTPPGGTVTLGASVAEDGTLAVTVADTGIGIDAEALKTVTEPFQQADASISRRFGGTGLGLAISRDLTELHGGTLDLSSTPGRGTVVTVTFPRERVVGEVEAASLL